MFGGSPRENDTLSQTLNPKVLLQSLTGKFWGHFTGPCSDLAEKEEEHKVGPVHVLNIPPCQVAQAQDALAIGDDDDRHVALPVVHHGVEVPASRVIQHHHSNRARSMTYLPGECSCRRAEQEEEEEEEYNVG